MFKLIIYQQKGKIKMKPINVTDVDAVFGGDISKLMPKRDDIPQEFKGWNSRSKWNKVVNDWFFNGLKNVKWTPKNGIDTEAALRHVSAIMASWEPKHEHKEAACAYLLSEFFEDVQYDT